MSQKSNSADDRSSINIINSLWDEIGYTQEEKDEALRKINSEIEKVRSKFIENTLKQCQKVLEDTEQIRSTHISMLKAIDAPEDQIRKVKENGRNGTIKEKYDEVKSKFKEFSKMYKQRYNEFESLQKQIDNCFKAIGITDPSKKGEFIEVGEDDLTPARLRRYEEKVNQLSSEVGSRLIQFNSLKKKILSMNYDLQEESPPEIDEIFEKQIYSDQVLEKLNDHISYLKNLLNSRSKYVSEMAVEINRLWDLLEVDEPTRREFLSSHNTLSQKNVQDCIDEADRLIKIRNQKLPEIIEKMKFDLSTICQSLGYSKQKEKEICKKCEHIEEDSIINNKNSEDVNNTELKEKETNQNQNENEAPKSDDENEVLKADNENETPKTKDENEAPDTENKKENPESEDEPEAPKIENENEASNIDVENETSKTEDENEAPKLEDKKEIPNPEDETETSNTEDKKDVKKAEVENEAQNIEDKKEIPKPEDETETLNTEDKKDVKNEAPNAEDKKEIKKAEVENEAQKTKDENEISETEDKSEISKIEDENELSKTEVKNEISKIDDENSVDPNLLQIFNNFNTELLNLKKAYIFAQPIIDLINQREQIINDYEEVMNKPEKKSETVDIQYYNPEVVKIRRYDQLNGKNIKLRNQRVQLPDHKEKLHSEKVIRRHKFVLPRIEKKLYIMLLQYREEQKGDDFIWKDKPIIEELGNIQVTQDEINQNRIRFNKIKKKMEMNNDTDLDSDTSKSYSKHRKSMYVNYDKIEPKKNAEDSRNNKSPRKSTIPRKLRKIIAED